MKKILVPCDFSKPAISAYRFALDLAAQSNGTVYVLNVVELPVLYDTTLMPSLYFEQQMLNDQMKEAKHRFEKIRDKYKSDSVEVVFHCEFGLVHPMIEHFIKKDSIDLVVMGSHGTSGFREFFIGSNAERTVRYSSVPVLIMKDFYKGPIKNIVFPNTLDTDDQEELTMKVKALQEFFKAHLHVVWINTPLNFSPDNITYDRLKAFAKRFMLKDYTISVYNHIDTEQGIMAFSKHIKGDLIAMATHGRTGISHLVKGSVTEDVVNHTSGLVWTYSLVNEPVEA